MTPKNTYTPWKRLWEWLIGVYDLFINTLFPKLVFYSLLWVFGKPQDIIRKWEWVIILLPGFLCNSSTMIPIGKFLEENTLQSIIYPKIWIIDWLYKSLNVLTEESYGYTRELMQTWHIVWNPDITIIGHSTGWVIALRIAGMLPIKNIIQISTGYTVPPVADLPWLWWIPSIYDMRKHSIQNGNIHFLERIEQLWIIVSQNDTFVPASCQWVSHTNEIVGPVKKEVHISWWHLASLLGNAWRMGVRDLLTQMNIR